MKARPLVYILRWTFAMSLSWWEYVEVSLCLYYSWVSCLLFSYNYPHSVLHPWKKGWSTGGAPVTAKSWNESPWWRLVLSYRDGTSWSINKWAQETQDVLYFSRGTNPTHWTTLPQTPWWNLTIPTMALTLNHHNLDEAFIVRHAFLLATAVEYVYDLFWW